MMNSEIAKICLDAYLLEKKWPSLGGTRWTVEQQNELKEELRSRYLLDPIFMAALDCIASMQFDFIELKNKRSTSLEDRK